MRRYGRVAGGVLAGCLVAGCSGLPGMDPAAWQGVESPSATPPSTTSGTQKTPEPSASAPALTAESVIKEYIERNNKANKALDEKLLATYEGGSSLAIDKAGYASQRKLGGRDSYTPFEYVKPTFAAPASKRWFLATTYWKNKKKSAKTPTFLLFAHDQGAWKQVYAPDVFDTIDADELPKIQTDASGAATEVDSADGDGLLMSPADFAKNYAAHMTGKGSNAAKSRFASDQFTTGAAKNRIKMRQFAKITEHAAPAKEYPSYALRTADGGALVFTTFARTKVYDVIQSPKRYYVFQENNGLLPDKYYKFLKVGDLVQVAAHIPPKTASPAQVQVLGTYSGIVAGRGA